MKDPMVTITANCLCSGGGFGLRVENPVQDSSSGDYYCKVVYDLDSGAQVDMYGIDASQAIRLGVEIAAVHLFLALKQDIIDNPSVDST